MQVYMTINALLTDQGLNPRVTQGPLIVEGEVDVDAAIAAFDFLAQLADSGSHMAITLVDGGGIHLTHSAYHWRPGFPDPRRAESPRYAGYYYQLFPLTGTGSDDFARFHRHVSDYAIAHPERTSAEVKQWLAGPYRLVPNA